MNTLDLGQLPSNLATFICGHVFRGERPVHYVFSDEDGYLSMLCGFDDCDVEDVSNCLLVGLGEMLERDPSLINITNFPLNTEACRGPNGTWIYTPITREN